MWKTICKQTYRLLYYLGKTPPASAEIEVELDRLGQTPEKGGTPAPAAPGERCDCLVTAGNRKVGCYPNKLVAACNLIA
jgi:hypothetical protein